MAFLPRENYTYHRETQNISYSAALRAAVNAASAAWQNGPWISVLRQICAPLYEVSPLSAFTGRWVRMF